jgi:uncharacterized protein YbjT (DUF2867 family)
MKVAVAGATGRAGRHVVDVLRERGHEVVAMSRSTGVDVISRDGLADALAGVECIVDTATGPSADREEATEFFTTAARNLHDAGAEAGVRRIVGVSIIGCDKFKTGYNVAKVAHEKALFAGPVPATLLRAAQFHELVGLMVGWGTQGDVAHVPEMRIQPVAARTVAEALADLATDFTPPPAEIPEIAGPREESFVELARKLVAHRGDPVRVEGVSYPDEAELYEGGALLPNAHAVLAGPTFDEWLG